MTTTPPVASAEAVDALWTLLETAQNVAGELGKDGLLDSLGNVLACMLPEDRDPVLQILEHDAGGRTQAGNHLRSRFVLRPNPFAQIYSRPPTPSRAPGVCSWSRDAQPWWALALPDPSRRKWRRGGSRRRSRCGAVSIRRRASSSPTPAAAFSRPSRHAVAGRRESDRTRLASEPHGCDVVNAWCGHVDGGPGCSRSPCSF